LAPTSVALQALRRQTAALMLGLVLPLVAAAQGTAPTPAPDGADAVMRIVGGLAGLNQYTRHEAPFWSERLATLSGGRYRAEIVPFDRAGIRGAELLPMVRLGTVPFGTLLLSQAAPRDAELVAADLAGLSADMATLRKVVAAWRPRLAALLRERHGAELLAVYAYPAQVLFCRRALEGLEGLRGLRVRTASPTQADFVRALGGEPLTVPLAQLLTRMGSGGLDCAITGTMTGHTIGLDGITTHLLPLPVSWGLAVFVAHGPSWQALPGPLRELLQQELPRLEAAIWDEAERETAEGIACSTGRGPCSTGRAARMALVAPGPRDDALRRKLLEAEVLPMWLARCGPDCATEWNRRLAPLVGVRATFR
jgi:TRAP-type C4-dicarboxylate transport system substrate-binding protein